MLSLSAAAWAGGSRAIGDWGCFDWQRVGPLGIFDCWALDANILRLYDGCGTKFFFESLSGFYVALT